MDLMTFSEQSAFLEKIIEQLKLIDTPIIAPDVAMPVAMHYVMHHNHCVKSIMIGDGPGVLPSADGSLIRKIVGSAFWRAMVRLNGARTLLETATQMDYLHYNITEGELNDYVQSYQGRIDQVVAYFASYPEHLKELDLKTNILKLPVHVFWGYTDASLSCENECLLDRRLQNNGLTIFENCGHFSYQDKPDEFVQMIRNWVTERHQAFASSK